MIKRLCNCFLCFFYDIVNLNRMYYVWSIKDEFRGDNENVFFFMLLFFVGIFYDYYSEKVSCFMVFKLLVRLVIRKIS